MIIRTRALLLVLIVGSMSTFAQTRDTVPMSSDVTIIDSMSRYERADTVEHRAKNDTVFVLRSREEAKDTVLLLTREGTHELLNTIKGEVRTSRHRGFGGALGPVPQVIGVRMKPLTTLIDRYPDLRNVGFGLRDGFEMFIAMGGMGYGALGAGLRIGGGGFGANRDFSVYKNDTSYTLTVGIGYGGVLIEKAYVRNDLNLFAGTLLGGGGITVDLQAAEGGSFFNVNTTLVGELPKGQANASFMLVEVHGGFTYSFLSWMHLGFDATMPCFLSGSGFRVGSQSGVTSGFFTVNPGIRLRIMLGNIG